MPATRTRDRERGNGLGGPPEIGPRTGSCHMVRASTRHGKRGNRLGVCTKTGLVVGSCHARCATRADMRGATHEQAQTTHPDLSGSLGCRFRRRCSEDLGSGRPPPALRRASGRTLQSSHAEARGKTASVRWIRCARPCVPLRATGERWPDASAGRTRRVPPGVGAADSSFPRRGEYSHPAPREGGLQSPGSKRAFPRGHRGSHPQRPCAFPVY